VGFCVPPEDLRSPSAVLNFSTTPHFTVSTLEEGCPSLSSHRLGLLTQRDGLLFGHPVPQLFSRLGKWLPGTLHPYAAGRGAASSASGMPPKSRGVGCPFNPHVFVTGQPSSSGRDMLSHRVATSLWDKWITRSAGEHQAETCLQQLLQAGWCSRSCTALFVLAWG